MKKFLITLIALAAANSAAAQDAASFYKEPPVFSTAPGPEKSLTNIKRFGPVGMGIDLIQPAFTMRISHIEEGSPAAQAEKLEAGQIIESINGQKLADIDPRIQLGQILAAAEASDGVLKFAIRGVDEPVVVNIPVLGAYSETWPLDCPKSERIVRDFAAYLAKPDSNKGFSGIGMLFLLSTGDDTDLEVVRDWAREAAKKTPTYAWHLGYGGIPFCEYYLRTGDEEVLPGIQNWVDSAVKGQYMDAWAGRGGVPRVTYGGGHLNAGGTAVLTFMLLAKECGADVPDRALLGALQHFYKYAGRGSTPYGDSRPEMGFVDNGKQGNLAFAMAAAAALTPNGENSVYAEARDVCAMSSFYTTTFMLHGHTGGGIGEIWRSPAMGLLHEKRPKQYREFMDHRQWHYDLSRRFDGSFGILGGAGYDKEEWGAAYPLTYTVPRKTLRITGAPPTEFSKPYQLPKLPWGNEADNIFVSLEAAPDADGKKHDLTQEALVEDSSRGLFVRLHNSGEVSDDTLRRYIRHSEHNIRFVASNKILGVNSGYIGWRSPGGEVRTELMMESLRDGDPRVRAAMFQAIDKRPDVIDREIFDLAIQAVQDEAESWWVKDAALHVISHAEADWVVPHVDLLLPILDQEDWWLPNAALKALATVAADERCYRKVLPAVGELVRNNQRWALTSGPLYKMREKLKVASPEVQQLAKETLQETFADYAGVDTAPGGQDVSSTKASHLEFIAASLADVEGGLDVLYEVARDKHPNEILPYKTLFLGADSSRFGEKLKAALNPIIMDDLIPEYVGRNRARLDELAAAEVQNGFPGGSRDAIDGLVGLYDRAGYEEFGWTMFADLRNAEWSYHSFDPIAEEQVPFDQLVTRYRDVTLPDGMKTWFGSEFDPAAAGWKTGKSPFGHYMGKLPTGPITKCSADCTGPACFGATPMNTFWEKEVLLMRGEFEIPPLKEGHRYRIRVNDGNHVGAGGGHIVYVNGRTLIEVNVANGRGSGGLPKGAYITNEFLQDFRRGKVTIAVKTFLRFGDKYKVKPTTSVPQGKMSIHIEEQKLPPMGDDLVFRSAAVIPMMSSEWQAALHSESAEVDPEDAKFRWDGVFEPNQQLLGSWKAIAQVAAIDEFDPETKPNRGRPIFSAMTFEEGGKTGDVAWAWSGDVLMDLTKFQALKMVVRTIDGEDYLFIENGGFSNRNRPEWKTLWNVLAR